MQDASREGTTRDATPLMVPILHEKLPRRYDLDHLLVTIHPSFPRKRESMLLALIAGLCKNNELPMSTLNDNSDGFPRKRE